MRRISEGEYRKVLKLSRVGFGAKEIARMLHLPLDDVEKIITIEKRRVSELVKAGQARARAAGKRIGGQPGNYTTQFKTAAKMREQGYSYEAIARAVKLSVPTVYYHLNPEKKKGKTKC